MYRQALLALGDAGLAEQVVRDVITDECLRLAPDPDRAQYRLGSASAAGAALALVVFGQLGYVDAAGEMAIPPPAWPRSCWRSCAS